MRIYFLSPFSSFQGRVDGQEGGQFSSMNFVAGVFSTNSAAIGWLRCIPSPSGFGLVEKHDF